MSARTIRIGVLAVCAAFVIAAPAYGALIRWTPEKVEAKLKADTPINAGDGSAVLIADCQGLGKGLKGKYVRFQCKVRYGALQSYTINLRLLVQQIGPRRLCVSAYQATANGGTAPWTAPGRIIRPEKTCTRA